MAIPRERLLPILERMLLMRRVEEATFTLGPKEVFGNDHVYFGQEATGALATPVARWKVGAGARPRGAPGHRCQGRTRLNRRVIADFGN